jgi:hypothetical protein
MALRPSPHARSSARPGSSAPVSSARKQFDRLGPPDELRGHVALIPTLLAHVTSRAANKLRT